MVKDGQKYLITTTDWFYAPDGEHYRAAWGIVKLIKTSDALGFDPRRSVNWLLEIGEGNGMLTVGGCQVNYAVRCQHKPNLKLGVYIDKDTETENVKNRIYIPDDVK